MFVKNTGAKAMGFGSLILLPNESAELPKGFEATHPTVAFYIRKGFLTVVNAEPAAEPAEQEVGTKANDFASKTKALATMKLDELRSEAVALGLSFEDTDTRAILAAKITEKYQAQ